jgi:hypothetical protein
MILLWWHILTFWKCSFSCENSGLFTDTVKPVFMSATHDPIQTRPTWVEDQFAESIVKIYMFVSVVPV